MEERTGGLGQVGRSVIAAVETFCGAVLASGMLISVQVICDASCFAANLPAILHGGIDR
jgi:hypothetical protein